MKRLILILALLVTSACVHPAPGTSLPPGADVILTAKQAVIAIGTVQHAAIELNKIQQCDAATPPVCHPFLSTQNTTVVVDAATDALTAMKAIPSGWKATSDAALARMQLRLDAAGKTQLATYLSAARAALALLP